MSPVVENGECRRILSSWSQNEPGVSGALDPTHHTKGEGVAGFRHGQTLDHLRSHPRERAHQGHVRCVRQEL